MPDTNIENWAHRIAAMPPVQWNETFEKLRNPEHEHHAFPQPQAIGDSLNGHAIRYARAAAYVNTRLLGRSHEEAVRETNKVSRAIRKALGYTSPEAGDFNF